MTQWNPAQLEAIQTRDKNILVCASAGSGKTTVLIARLMDLVVKDRISIDNILAMTFTEAAANEMKKRLASALNEQLEKAREDDNESEIAYLNQQLSSLQTASISTIHSFALSIVQKYYYMIGLSAQRVTNILDPASVRIYKQQALEQAFLTQYQKQDDAFLKLCEIFSARPEDEEALRSFVVKMEENAAAQPNPVEWLEHLTDSYLPKSSISQFDEMILEPFFMYLQRIVEPYVELLDQLSDVGTMPDFLADDKIEALNQKVANAKQLLQCTKVRDYTNFMAYYRLCLDKLLPETPRKKNIDATLKENYKTLRGDIHKLEDEMVGKIFPEDILLADMARMLPYVEKLIEICKDYRQAFQDAKEKAQGIDFDDMEHYALEILRCNDFEVANRLREQYHEIMVDEFQDSNAVQDSMVQLICRKNNVFRVGDVKQSIYGFRHARPELMKGLMQHQGAYDKVICLNNNYRSKYSIVQFNNELFERLMNVDGFDKGFDEADYAYTGIPAQQEDNYPTTIHLLNKEILKDAYSAEKFSDNEIKAEYISNCIYEMHEQGGKWKDFVVLVRKNKEMDYLKACFERYRIPYFIASKSGYYESEAVSTFISVLKAIVNPYDDIAFTAAMISSFFDKNEADFTTLAKLKKEHNLNNPDNMLYSYYDCMKQYPDHTINNFRRLRALSFKLDLEDLLKELLEYNNYYHLHCSLQEKTNLDLFFENAMNYEKQHGGGLSGFLSLIEEIRQEGSGEAIPIDSDADVVRVMSIHQSKGLQFKNVFLWSTNKLDVPEFRNFGIVDATMGLGLRSMQLPERFHRSTLLRLAMEQKKTRENLEEEMRILYVATTRPQQQLHIVEFSDVADKLNTLNAHTIYTHKNYTAWMLCALAKYLGGDYDCLLNYLDASDNPLFTIHLVSKPWGLYEGIDELEEQVILQPYQKTASGMRFKAATDYKAKPVLHKNSEGMLYGTRMHKMVEVCKDSDFSKEAILQAANKLGIPFSDNDVTKLQNLANHPTFKAFLQQENRCELPYLVKIDDEVVHGYIDFIAFDHDQKIIDIVDFKTDRMNQKEAFVSAYRQQLNTYCQAIGQLYPNYAIRAHIYGFYPNELYTL